MSPVVLRRHPILVVFLAALVLFLGLALCLHQVTMDHHSGHGTLGGCVVMLALALLVVVPLLSWSAPLYVPHFPAPAATVPLTAPAPRAPPDEGPLEGTVLRH